MARVTTAAWLADCAEYLRATVRRCSKLYANRIPLIDRANCALTFPAVSL